MKWFKHYNDASRGTFLCNIMEEYGHQGYAVYFLLVELCHSKFLEKPDLVFRFHRRILKEYLRISHTNVEKYLKCFQELGQLSYKLNENIFEIDFNKLLEIMDKDTKHNRNKIARKSQESRLDIEREKEREKEKEGDSAIAAIAPAKKKKPPKKLVEVIDPEIFDLAQKYGVIKKHDLTPDQIVLIKKALEKKKESHSLEAIHQAIENYKTAREGWYRHKFDLWDFLSRPGAVRFYGNSFDPAEYERGHNKSEAHRMKADEVMRELLEEERLKNG